MPNPQLLPARYLKIFIVHTNMAEKVISRRSGVHEPLLEAQRHLLSGLYPKKILS
jgi:hypothetical protein